MPRIIVQADAHDADAAPVLLAERVNPSDFESEHFSAQLVERIGWAVADADELPPARAPAAKKEAESAPEESAPMASAPTAKPVARRGARRSSRPGRVLQSV